jgi:hypothetical protein
MKPNIVGECEKANNSFGKYCDVIGDYTVGSLFEKQDGFISYYYNLLLPGLISVASQITVLIISNVPFCV